jgi:hypothetical protein
MTWIHSFLNLFLEMAPWLWIGFISGGVIQLFLKPSTLQGWLQGNSFWASCKASLFGVPLPLCSCSIIPVAEQMKKNGMNKGNTLSFLTSTPSTGVDSFLATWGILGPAFAIYRSLFSFVSGTIAGWVYNINAKPVIAEASQIVKPPPPIPATLGGKLKSIYSYTIYELIRDITPLLLFGLAIGASIETLLPKEWFESFFTSQWTGYASASLLGLPLYVCATGSLPIGLAFLNKGLSLGGVFLFLTLGPATNSATLAFVFKKLGFKALVVYLGTLVSIGLAMALFIDYLMPPQILENLHTHEMHLGPWQYFWSLTLALAMLLSFKDKFLFFRKKTIDSTSGDVVSFVVPGMTCEGCANKIKQGLYNHPETKAVFINVPDKLVKIQSSLPAEEIKILLSQLDYPPQD